MSSTDEDDEEVGLPALPHGTKNYMTPQCYRRMLDEREHLVRVERPEMANVVAWAASNGDRSENGDYLYGKLVHIRLFSPIVRITDKGIRGSVTVPGVHVGAGSHCLGHQFFFGGQILIERIGRYDSHWIAHGKVT